MIKKKRVTEQSGSKLKNIYYCFVEYMAYPIVQLLKIEECMH